MKDLKSSKPAHLKKRRPQFKKKGKATDSFYVGGDQVKVDGHWVKVPNLGWVRMAEPLKYGGHVNGMTISRKADKWFVSFSLNVDLCPLPSESQARCGVDLGIKTPGHHLPGPGNRVGVAQAAAGRPSKAGPLPAPVGEEDQGQQRLL
jgi:Probable transposase.